MSLNPFTWFQPEPEHLKIGKQELRERAELRAETKPDSTPAQRRQWAWDRTRKAQERNTCGRHVIPGLEFGRPADQPTQGE
jgi:hypothetical protein